MNLPRLKVESTPKLAVCRLSPADKIPDWALESSFYCIVKTASELSLVCEQALVPEGCSVETDWSLLSVVGPLDFELVGIVSSISQPLAQAGISIFVVSTFDTDYILVKSRDLSPAIQVLESSGFEVSSA